MDRLPLKGSLKAFFLRTNKHFNNNFSIVICFLVAEATCKFKCKCGNLSVAKHLSPICAYFDSLTGLGI